MTSAPEPEGWVDCGCGARHWGRYGAAGLLLGDGERVVLQHRAAWSHHGDTWALPGGALHRGEDAVTGALREAAEEAGVEADLVQVVATSALHHPDWSYTTVLARAEPGLPVAATDAESVSIGWVPDDDVADHPLLPAFAEAWPWLRAMLAVRAHVVVDGANVVGSRPDGWWRDRRGAAARLIRQVEQIATAGVDAGLLDLPGERWWPRWHVVTEGAARGAAAGEPTGPVAVVEAPASGDDAIVALVERLADDGGHVVVVTADRALRDRCRAAGAAHLLGPGSLPTATS